MTRRVLLAWEFGAGLAHVMLLRGVGRHLAAMSGDLELIYGLPNIEAGLSVGLPDDKLVLAPHVRPKPGCPPLAPLQAHRTFGGIMGEALLGERQDGLRYFTEWNSLIAQVRPDVIVADYAPVATMLARGRIPAIACGIGYTLPPADIDRFPVFAKTKRPPLASEEELLERFNGVLAQVGGRKLDRLPQMNEADAYGLCTLPDFDVYADIPGREWLGAILPGGPPEPAQTYSGGLVYFHQKQQFEDNLVDGLMGSGISIDAYMGEPLRRTAKRARGSGLRLSDEPFELVRAMPGRAVAVHSGSLGFAAAAAFAGVPQVMLPKHQEHSTNTRRLVARGAGIVVPTAKRTPERLAAVIREAAESSAMRQAARDFAAALDPWRKADPARVIAERTLALIS